MQRVLLLVVAYLVMAFSVVRAAEGRQAILMAGILETDPASQCTTLRVAWDENPRLLENYGSFQVGDTVTVVATEETVTECGGHLLVFLPGNAIAAWRGFDFGCGTLYVDPEYHCGRLYTDNYGILSISGETGFQTGDIIHLYGNLFLEECTPIPECGGDWCMAPTNATTCSPTPTQATTWGRLKARYR